MRRRSRTRTALSSAARPADQTVLVAPPAGIGHPIVVAVGALLIALFTLTPSVQAQADGQTFAGTTTVESMGEPVGPWPPAGPEQE